MTVPAVPVHRRAVLRASLALAPWPAVTAWANTGVPTEVVAELPGARWSGEARMRYFGFELYDTRLWVGEGFRPQTYPQSPFALELGYLRGFSGPAIAERSLQEMRRIGAVSAEQERRWLAAMQEVFPDIKAGDRLLGLHTPGRGARFWHNGRSRPEIRDPEFSRLFFGIWLAESSSEPRVRSGLLAGAVP